MATRYLKQNPTLLYAVTTFAPTPVLMLVQIVQHLRQARLFVRVNRKFFAPQGTRLLMCDHSRAYRAALKYQRQVPKSSCTERRSAPPPERCVARLWRSGVRCKPSIPTTPAIICHQLAYLTGEKYVHPRSCLINTRHSMCLSKKNEPHKGMF